MKLKYWKYCLFLSVFLFLSGWHVKRVYDRQQIEMKRKYYPLDDHFFDAIKIMIDSSEIN